MRAHNIMSRPVHTVRTVDTIERAAKLLADNKITAAPVLDEAGALVGMVSEGDLLWHRVPADPTAHLWRSASGNSGPRPHLVADVMSRHVVTAWLRADVADIAQLMLRHDVRSVPIVEDGVLLGIVSRHDILRTVVRTDDVLRAEIQHRLDEYAGLPGGWTTSVTDGAATVDGDFDDDAERTVVTILARTVPGVAAVRIAQSAH